MFLREYGAEVVSEAHPFAESALEAVERRRELLTKKNKQLLDTEREYITLQYPPHTHNTHESNTHKSEKPFFKNIE